MTNNCNIAGFSGWEMLYNGRMANGKLSKINHYHIYTRPIGSGMFRMVLTNSLRRLFRCQLHVALPTLSGKFDSTCCSRDLNGSALYCCIISFEYPTIFFAYLSMEKSGKGIILAGDPYWNWYTFGRIFHPPAQLQQLSQYAKLSISKDQTFPKTFTICLETMLSTAIRHWTSSCPRS